ncbi:MAG: RadC family protein [Flavobacteriaceae bacterium]|jgi:DNA repair protein RadC
MSQAMSLWSAEDQPRERLMSQSPQALSNAELISLILGTGVQHQSALAVAQSILASADHQLASLATQPWNDWVCLKGVGTVKAVRLAAAMELSRRIPLDPFITRCALTSSQAVYHLLKPKLAHLPHEEFWVLYLNNAHKLLYMHRLSQGGITATYVDIRLLLKEALQRHAVAIVVAHNHPSGQLQPSVQDRELTEKIKKAVELIDIKLLDHLVITQQEYLSFADQHWL